MFGKWHCGWLPWYSPLRIGFQTFFGNLDGAIDYFEHVNTLGQADLYEGETPVEEVGYYTELISDRAAEYITARPRRPVLRAAQLHRTALAVGRARGPRRRAGNPRRFSRTGSTPR